MSERESPGITFFINEPLSEEIMLYHVTWSTYGSWLPGDPRGFRTRGHRLHVDGDYRNPPPKGKYTGLHAHAKSSLVKPAVVIP